MKAVLFHEYGPPEVLQYGDCDKPLPGDRDVIVRVRATPVNFADTLVRNFRAVSPQEFHMPWLFWLIGRLTFGWRRPHVRILGSEFSGVIAETGRLVTRFKTGDAVFGYCGPRMGANAEFLRIREDGILTRKPDTMSFEEAAAVPYGAIMAHGLLRSLRLRPGDRVLVNGASGGIGPFVVQIAHAHFGARVAGVCGAARAEYVRSLGAETVYDYSKEDFTRSGETYDCIVDITGKCSLSRCAAALSPNGRLLYVSFKAPQVWEMLWTSVLSRKKAVCVLIDESLSDLCFVSELIEAGKVRAVVDTTFPLREAAAAHRYAESGMRKGTVVIAVP